MRVSRALRSWLPAMLLCATLLWAAVYHFGVPPRELAGFALYCVVGVVAIALLAAVCLLSVQLLRWGWRRLRRS